MRHLNRGGAAFGPAMGLAAGLAFGLAAAVLTGCGGAQTRATDREAARYADPLERSSLRETALAALEDFTANEIAQTRANALEAMSAVPSRLEPFVASALQDENVGVRSVAAMLVGRRGLCSLAPSVRGMLRDESAYVRASAIFALRRCGEDADPTPLGRMLLNDPSPRVRAHAAFILGELGDRSAVPMLRQAAVARSERASTPEARLMQLQIAEALIKLGENSQLQTVRAALYPSRPEELEATALAVQIIGEVEDRGSIDQLIYLSALRGPDRTRMPAEVRLAVASSMAKLGMTEGSFIADDYVEDEAPAIRAQAAYVYGQTGRVANLARLEKMLEDPSDLVRVSAAAGVLAITESGRSADVGGSR